MRLGSEHAKCQVVDENTDCDDEHNEYLDVC